MTSAAEAQHNAALEFANAAAATFGNNGSMHPGTVVAATARMAGTYLFRSFGHKLAGVRPGQAVLSTEANERGPVLLRIVAGILDKGGIKLDDAQAGKPVEPQHAPTLPFLDTQRKIEPVFKAIRDRITLSEKEAAYAAAFATAFLIQHCAKVMDPSVAFGIATCGIVEGSKTAPDPVQLP